MKTNKNGNSVVVGVMVMLALFILMFFTFSIKVPVGYTAIKVDVYGQNVEPKGLHTGRNFVNVITNDTFKYPIFVQQTEYSALRFQDKSGLVITADIGMDYKFDENKIGSLYEEYKAGVDKITNDYMFTWVKNAVNRASSEFEIDKLYGEDKEIFRLKVLANLQEDLGAKGINVNNVYFVNEMQLPTAVKSRINAKIEATQNAMQVENELRTTTAEAQKVVAKAKGFAEAKLLEAQAIADANKLVNASITPNLIQYNTIEAWNGELPQVTGGSIPMINLK